MAKKKTVMAKKFRLVMAIKNCFVNFKSCLLQSVQRFLFSAFINDTHYCQLDYFSATADFIIMISIICILRCMSQIMQHLEYHRTSLEIWQFDLEFYTWEI